MTTSDDSRLPRPSPGQVGEQAHGRVGGRMVSSVPTVLFVDEPDVLDSLRVGFRRHRNDFELRFVGSADEAMALMEHEPVDLVVTDMRMPVRSGADLLEELRFRHPDVIRFVLSGQAEDRLVHRSVAVSHRWLSKPCDHEVLLAAIAEATARRSEIDDPMIRRAIGTIDALPSHPEAFRTLVDELARPDITADEVVGAAAADPAVTVKLLQWANSVYGDGRPVYDVRRAVERIGIEALTRLSSAEEMVRPSTPSEVIPGFGIDLFHRHARMVAGIAAGLTDPERADLAGAAGLLSGIGLLIEVRYLQKRLIVAYQRA